MNCEWPRQWNEILVGLTAAEGPGSQVHEPTSCEWPRPSKVLPGVQAAAEEPGHQVHETTSCEWPHRLHELLEVPGAVRAREAVARRALRRAFVFVGCVK
jgi:hypothetical protein